MPTSPVSPRSSRPAPTATPTRRAPSTSGFPFPSEDSPRRPGSSRQATSTSTTLRTRRGSNASSILSLDNRRVGGADTIAEVGSNAISTLLQPPIIRTGLLPHTHAPSGVRPPNSRDIPPVTLTSIPHVEPGAFNAYIQQAGSLYRALQQAREEQAGSERRQSIGRRNSEVSEDGRHTQYHGMQRRPSAVSGLPPTPGSPIPKTPLTENAPSLRRKPSADGGTPRRRPGLTAAPLSTIPNIYFDEDFHLENPRTFDIVSEKSEIIRQPAGKETNGDANGLQPLPGAGAGGRKALAANAILQEKLSWYMDTVEIHLIQSISTASTSFFDALKELRELHAEAEASVKQIEVLREDLARLDENMAVGGLEVVAMKRKRDNLRTLGDAIKQLEAVMDAFAACEDQIQQGDMEVALLGLDDLERLIKGDVEGRKASKGFQGPLIDLTGLKALGSASEDIAYLRKRIGSTLEGKFIATLLGDLRQHIDKVPANDTFKRWDQTSSRRRGQHLRTPSGFAAPPAYVEIDPPFREDLRNQLKSLAKADTVMQATATYREAVQKEFRNIIRRHVPSSSDDDVGSTMSVATTTSRSRGSAQEKSQILARNLRNLEPEDAETMFRSIYSNVGEALRRLSTQVKVMLDITSSLSAPPSGARSPPLKGSPRIGSIGAKMNEEAEQAPLIAQAEMQQVLDLSSLLGQVVDLAQNQVTKLLKVRSEQSAALDPAFFLRYFTVNRLFAEECEAVTGRSGLTLRTVVNEHIKTFVQNAGETERQGLIRRMDADLWDARDFGAEEAKMLKAVTDASTMEIDDWAKLTIIWSDDSNGTVPANGLGIGIPSINEPANSASNTVIPDSSTNGISTPVSRPSTPLPEGQKAAKATVRAAELDEQSFLLPASALAVLSGIVAYLRLVTCIPTMAPDIALSLLEYLRLFNSRSQQLILGAGATRSAGLKNITAKHLVLSSQALSFVAALVPYIRECVRRYLPTAGAGSGVLADFDKVKRTLQEHQTGIVDKLVDIMNGRAVAHIVSFKKVDWESSDAGSVGTYMETLAKETTMFQKILMRHLPEEAGRGIMTQVMGGYRDVWEKAFQIVELRSQGAKERLLRDAEYFKARMGRLEGANDMGDHIVNLVQKKKVIGSSAPAASAAPAVPTSTPAATEARAPNADTEKKEDNKQNTENGKESSKTADEEKPDNTNTAATDELVAAEVKQ